MYQSMVELEHMKTPDTTQPHNDQHSLANTQTIKRFNVTNMTPSERRKLFVNRISQNGFTAFIKNKENKQTYYVFHYETRSNPRAHN